MGVGSPQRWPVQPEERQRLPEKSAPEGQSGAKEEASQREGSLCRARWSKAALSVPVDGTNVGAAPSSAAVCLDLLGSPFLAQRHSLVTHPLPLNFCPELLTPRGLWSESPEDAPVGCGLRKLMTSRVLGLRANPHCDPPG